MLSRNYGHIVTLNRFQRKGYESYERHGVTPSNNGPKNVDGKVFFKLCFRGRITEGIIGCFLEYFPAAANYNESGMTLLLAAVNNKRVSLNIAKLLLDAAPNSVRCVGVKGTLPLHHLCGNEVNEELAVEILKLLIDKHPEGVRHVDNDGRLPLHHACKLRSSEFCRVLIEAYPGSERIPDENNFLPLVSACLQNDLATVEYFYNLYPDDIDHRVSDEFPANPILLTIASMDKRTNPRTAVEIVKFLLNRNPNLSTQTFDGKSPLFTTCNQIFVQNLDIEAGLQIIKVVFDAHPEAIEGNDIALYLDLWNEQIQAFINSQLVYARQASDHRQMTTPDDNGQLPLHTALQSNVRLGSIKLLVKGNSTAVHSPDNSSSLPLHVACQNHDSTVVIQYLVGLDTSTLEAVDNEHNTALHYACRSAKYETIAMLLEKYDAVSISKQNADGKLPLDLLLESNEVVDRGSIEYTESIFRLLRAHPETVMNYNVQ